MRLTTFWHVMVGLNMGLAVLSWSLHDSSMLLLNLVSGVACIVAAQFAARREELEED
tara:strand:+ start:74 stop:244 length:171 start_codon:yes stop_codon:yes gene_type:complete